MEESESPLTNDEAAAFLKWQPKTLHNKRSQKRGPRYVKIGGSIRYHPRDLRAFLDHNTHETADSVVEEPA